MTKTEEKWSERIRHWQDSGKTAEEFTAEQPYKASTLKWRAAELRRQAEGGARHGKLSASTKSIRMARVFIRKGAAGDVAGRSGGLIVEVSGARISLSHGFDPKLFADVVRALASRTTR
jgi:hypothetical protein